MKERGERIKWVFYKKKCFWDVKIAIFGGGGGLQTPMLNALRNKLLKIKQYFLFPYWRERERE